MRFSSACTQHLQALSVVIVFHLIQDVRCEIGSKLRCHWCGPLAEEVHRSTRPGGCIGDDLPVTECEPGYNYCATVATAYPYSESRFCVKLYQDECYPQHCNTTNRWKMTCPCSGSLCNGPNKDREQEAFAKLIQLAAKSSLQKSVKSGQKKTETPLQISKRASNKFASYFTRTTTQQIKTERDSVITESTTERTDNMNVSSTKSSVMQTLKFLGDNNHINSYEDDMINEQDFEYGKTYKRSLQSNYADVEENSDEDFEEILSNSTISAITEPVFTVTRTRLPLNAEAELAETTQKSNMLLIDAKPTKKIPVESLQKPNTTANDPIVEADTVTTEATVNVTIPHLDNILKKDEMNSTKNNANQKYISYGVLALVLSQLMM